MAYKPKILALTEGGTNASLTASNGGMLYSTASAVALLAGTATAGQMLQSGASTTPAWSTATYPATAGTSGNYLKSDGTNFSSSALPGNLQTTGPITITNAQIKALRSTPIQLIAAPAAGSMIAIVCVTVKFNYGGNDAFVSGGNLNVYAGSTAGILYSGINSAIYTGTTDNIYAVVGPQANGATSVGVLEATAIVLSTGTSDPTGNASNDNTLVVEVLYQTLTL